MLQEPQVPGSNPGRPAISGGSSVDRAATFLQILVAVLKRMCSCLHHSPNVATGPGSLPARMFFCLGGYFE